MAQYATCCLCLSDFDMPCPWYLFETGSPSSEHSWRCETSCTCSNPVSGLLYLAGAKGIEVRDEYEKPNNFTWDNFWEGSGTGLSAFVNGLYNVIWYESSASGSFACIFY